MIPERFDVAIVGAGITGLVTARALSIQDATMRIAVLEATDRAGGNVQSERRDGFLLDLGPDGFVASKPHAAELCRALGLGDSLIETQPANRRTYVLHRGRLVPYPRGMFLVVPSRIGAFLATPLLDSDAKLRALRDLAIPARTDGRDESIASFVQRRLGPAMVTAFGDPVLAGIYAGDVRRLSVRATFPQLVALEREHGSLIRGAIALRRAREVARRGAAEPSAFLSLRDGMGALVDALVRSIPAGTIRFAWKLETLERHSDGWTLRGADGRVTHASRVVLALPTHTIAKLLSSVDTECASLLATVPCADSAAVFLGYEARAVAHPLDATGCLFPRAEGREITATTWASSKWPGRAPAGSVLFRAFLGGASRPSYASRSDADLVALVRRELEPMLVDRGEPQITRVVHYRRLNPQPAVGHVERMAAAMKRLDALGGITMAAGGIGGVGLPDCTKQGEAAARRIFSR